MIKQMYTVKYFSFDRCTQLFMVVAITRTHTSRACVFYCSLAIDFIFYRVSHVFNTIIYHRVVIGFLRSYSYFKEIPINMGLINFDVRVQLNINVHAHIDARMYIILRY